jgi:hypothetical protein
MLYVETDSIGPILNLVEAQVDSPHQANIRVGRNGPLFTIRIQDEDVRSGGTLPEKVDI